MFRGASSLNSDFDHWDVSGIEEMSELFTDASSFNGNIENWDVSKVTNMGFMFQSATVFNQDLGGWYISNVTEMAGMLDGSALSVENYDATLIGWDSQMVQSDVDTWSTGPGILQWRGSPAVFD